MDIKKIVYDDNGTTKVLKGQILKEDDYTYTILGLKYNDEVIIGKKYIISIKGDSQ